MNQKNCPIAVAAELVSTLIFAAINDSAISLSVALRNKPVHLTKR